MKGVPAVRRAGTSGANERLTELFAFMKDVTTLDDVATKSLTLHLGADDSAPRGYLTPISAVHASDPAVPELLTRWRENHQYAYPSRFTVTVEGTRIWLGNAVIGNADRLLFLVQDPLLRPLGHLGILRLADGRLEIDNVLRGEPGVPGLMTAAMRALEAWVLLETDAQALSLRVLESNTRAVEFYLRLGYSVSGSQPMVWRVDGESRTLVDTEGMGDEVFLTMSKDLQSEQPAADTILTAGPLIGVREATFCLDATRTGWNANHSWYLTRFEREFAEYVGAEYAMATSSCTGALHLAMLAAGIGPGDEVIVPETTWVATASAVAYTGAQPVFADVDPVTWTMDPGSVRSLITERTRAIVPVHLYGYAADMEALTELARETSLAVIEDAAPAIGTLVSGQPVGSMGDIGCYSFQGAKMLVTGEGGMLVTNDKELFDRAWKQQDHGRVPGTFWIDTLGRKYKMSNLTAALGLAQLESGETQIAKKRRINSWYREFLADVPHLSFQEERQGSRSICWMTSVTIAPESRVAATEVAAQLHEQGIDTRPVFPPISSYPIWGNEGLPDSPGPNASAIGGTSLNLPSGVRLSRASIERVANAIAVALTR